MSQSNPARIKGDRDLTGTVSFPSEPNGRSAELLLDSGQRLVIDRSALSLQPDGSYTVALLAEDIEAASQEAVVIPVAREEIRVEKRQRDSERVIVDVVAGTRRELIDIPLAREEIQLERVPVNRFVDAPVPVRQDGDVTIVAVMEEVLVVEKRLRVKEEIRLTRKKSVRREPREVELRTEEARVRNNKLPDN